MKKLGKLSLKQMEDEMDVIGGDDQREFVGGGGRVLLGSATNMYNCHSYAFHNGFGDPSDPSNQYNPSDSACWDNDPNDDIASQGYIRTSNPSPGDIAIHFHDSNNNGKYDFGEYIEHSSKVTAVANGVATRITGKWGQDGLYESDLDDPMVQIFYGSGTTVGYLSTYGY